MVLNGIDVSYWQKDIQVQNIKGDFVIVKATGGKGYVNPYCDRVYQRAKNAGKLVGFYHFAHDNGFQGSAIEEADFFVDNTRNYFGEAIPILDWEGDNKTDVNWALTFLNRVKERTGVKPLFYTYTSVINSVDFSPIAKQDYGLWIANYGRNDRLYDYKQPSPPQSNGWSVIAMYQYSSNTVLNGYDKELDANVFYGDANTWKAYCGKANNNPSPAPQPQPWSTNGKTLEQMATDVLNGAVGSGDERKNKLGQYYESVQAIVNERLGVIDYNQSHSILAHQVIAGKLSSGDTRKWLLGSYYDAIQAIVNQLL